MELEFEFDICSSKKSIGEYLKREYLDEEYKNIFENLLDVAKYPIVSCFEEHTFGDEYTRISDVKNGDVIFVKYYPYSQKYIDYYQQQIWGKVFFIDVKNDNIFMYYDTYRKSKKKYIRTICSMERDGCSYFGDNRSYDYSIVKQTLTKNQ